MTRESPDFEIDERRERTICSYRPGWSTSWLRPFVDLAAAGAVLAVGITFDSGGEGLRMFLAVAAGWATLRTLALLRPARMDWSIGSNDALFYCFDRPDETPSYFRATEIDPEQLARSGGPDTLLSRFRHPVYWWLTCWTLPSVARRELREGAERAYSEASDTDSLVSIEGNPSETVGETRILSASESDDALHLRAAPETVRDVVAEYFRGTHVLIAMCLLFGIEAAIAELLDALFVELDAGFALGAAVVATVVLLSILFFAVVRRDGPDTSTSGDHDGRPGRLVVGPESYEIRRPTLFGRTVGMRGESWRLMERIRIVERSRVGPSAAIAAVLRPLSSIDAFLIAAFTDGDREWLVRQVVPEGDS